MKIGICLSIVPPFQYHTGKGDVIPEIVLMDIPDDKLPKLV